MSWSKLRGALPVWVAVGWGTGLCIGISALLGVGAHDASAASTSAVFGVQLGPQKTGRYGTVQVNEASGGLEFRITLDSSLGKNADLHEFYFNLPDQFSGVRLTGSSCDGHGCTTPFQLESKKPTSGGANSRFDFRVNFGNGGSSKGNGNLEVATFRIDANSALALTPSPFDPSFTSRNLAVIFAAHVPGAKHVAATIGATSATPVPEPGTAALFGLGLVGLGWVGGRRRK